MTRCGRCGLVVRSDHVVADECVDALKAELASVRQEYRDEMREAQRYARDAVAEARYEAENDRGRR